jgi:hypothetical protein
VAAATLGATALPPEWSAISWQAGSLVTHEGHVFRAMQLAPGGHVPGASTRWEQFDLPAVWDKPVPEPTGVWKSWTGTQSAYDALPTKDPATLYVITP